MKKKWLFLILLVVIIIFTFLPLSFLDASPFGTSLIVTKDAECSSQGYCTWAIDKSAEQTSFDLKVGETAAAAYTVTVTPTYHETGRVVSGNIHIQNAGSEIASISYVIDRIEYQVNGVWYVLKTEYVAGTSTIASGSFTDVPYSIGFTPLAEATAYRNTAVVGLANYALPEGGTGFQAFTYTTVFSLAGGTITADAFAEVNDSLIGNLGETWVGDINTYTYAYTLQIGPYAEPGDYTIENTATVTGKDSNTSAADPLSIAVHVDAVNSKEGIKIESGIPGKGLDTAPGQQKPFNPNSNAFENAEMKE